MIQKKRVWSSLNLFRRQRLVNSMKAISKIPFIPLKDLLCYFVAACLALWCLGKSLPLVGIGIFSVGILILFYLSPPLFFGKRISLNNKLLWFLFFGIHLVFINPFHDNKHTFDFLLRAVFSFSFFLVLINVIDDVKLYRRMMTILIGILAAIALILIYRHLFIFHSAYLTSGFTYGDWYYGGRAGKNTLSFFLALVFPFVYARFSYKRNIINTVCLAIIGFATLYTLSRMALVSMVLSVVLFSIFSINKKLFTKQLVVLSVLLLLISNIFGMGIKTFLKLKNPTEVEAVQRGEKSFATFEGHRFRLLHSGFQGFVASPLFGHGMTSFRSQDKTGRSLSHNDYIQILYELGLIGFLAFLAILAISLKDLLACKRYVPHEYHWLWDGQIVCLISVSAMLLFINAYETAPFWFVLAGAQIFSRTVKPSVVPNLRRSE